MTREEAIAELNKAMDEISLGSYTYNGLERSIALEIGIKALEQEPILDKIRAEIKAMFPPSGAWMYDEGHEVEHTACEVLSDVLEIIDKYKAESEDKE